MDLILRKFRHSLIFKIILVAGLTILVSISALSYFSIEYQRDRAMATMVDSTDRLGTTIRLGAHYAMLLNSRDDIRQIIQNVGRQPGIESIRIYNKRGEVKFSKNSFEVDSTTNIKDEACGVCHRREPPQVELGVAERIRIFDGPEGRSLGIISPIYNEPGCSSADACHYHPPDKKVLGALDMVVSLKDLDQEMALFEQRKLFLAFMVFLATSGMLYWAMTRLIKQPVSRLIEGTQRIAKGLPFSSNVAERADEMGQLAKAIQSMGSEITVKQHELNKQRDEYQALFELVPCIITVQDKNYKLLRYNKEFEDKFGPQPGDFCFKAYKGRSEKCPDCPVEKTFEDGEPHCSEESAVDENGAQKHWFVTTSPIRNASGEIVAAMEMCLDITRRKNLEEKLERSEKKYHAIFNNIPNPVFVLDMEDLAILDCNQSALKVYGFDREELIGQSFLEFFLPKNREQAENTIKISSVINQARHTTKNGGYIFVDIRVSPSEYPGRKVLLVTASDITKKLETEQQLIQASKMATLGEMATGVAHELNQPLSVIKTASSFLMRKIRNNDQVKPDILLAMSEEIDAHVDRAARIINHMREFGRKSDMTQTKVQLNAVMERAFDIFHQQLKLREIDVQWELDPELPEIMGDAGRLEQVFINLLINARDAIEEKWAVDGEQGDKRKSISLRTRRVGRRVIAEVEDSGPGIPKGIHDRLFEPFFTTKEVGKGTGLGLSISYGIVKDCGGTIRAESRQGSGALFVLTFPATEAA